jgi:hypothetical protein
MEVRYKRWMIALPTLSSLSLRETVADPRLGLRIAITKPDSRLQNHAM